MHTVVSLIPNDEHVTHVGDQLQANGIAEEKIHILDRAADVWQQLNGRQQIHTAVKDALIGMMLGLVVGQLYGVTAGVLNCRLMGCPVSVSLMMLALISIYWMAAGAFLGGIIGFDQLDQKLYGYLRGVQQGDALFIVETADKQADTVVQILKREEGSLVHTLE